MPYVSSSEACKFFGVTAQTLRRWDRKNKIQVKITEGGHRRYLITKKSPTRKKIIYARVSSKKQSADLKRQVKYLQSKYPDYQLITDIGSGINFKRKGLKTVLDYLFKEDLQELVVATSDRLTRFGIELFEDLFFRFNAQLTVIDNESDKTQQQELAEDLLSIVTVFTARYHGSRNYKHLSEDSTKTK